MPYGSPVTLMQLRLVAAALRSRSAAALRRVLLGIVWVLSEHSARLRAARNSVRMSDAEKAELSEMERLMSVEMILFYRQLGDLLRAGVPLLRAIRLLAGMRSNRKLAQVLGQVADSVEEGERLADSMAAFPQTFPEIQTSIVRAGERGGFIDSALDRLATFMDQRADMQSKVIGNLIYPIVLLAVGMGIVVAALVFFVPRFEDFFAGMDLPASTVLLMAMSRFTIAWWPLLLVLLAGLVPLTLHARGQVSWRRRFERFRLALPVLGPLGRAIACARFCRVLGTMLENGIPLIESMQIARGAVGSLLLEEVRLASRMGG